MQARLLPARRPALNGLQQSLRATVVDWSIRLESAEQGVEVQRTDLVMGMEGSCVIAKAGKLRPKRHRGTVATAMGHSELGTAAANGCHHRQQRSHPNSARDEQVPLGLNQPKVVPRACTGDHVAPGEDVVDEA